MKGSVLVPVDRDRLLKFIERFVNVRDEDELRAVRKGFPEFLNGYDLYMLSADEPGGVLQTALRRAWQTQELRERLDDLSRVRELFRGAYWSCYVREHAEHGELHQNYVPPKQRHELVERTHPFERALDALEKLSRRMRVCGNRDCRNTQFFLTDKKRRKFCTRECADPSRKASKNRWWMKNRSATATGAPSK